MYNELLFMAGSLGRLVRKNVDRILRSTGLTSAMFTTLLCIDELGGACQKEIEDRLILSRATVSSMLDVLERGGLIVRNRDQEDGRVRHIMITDEGHARFSAARERMKNIENGMGLAISSDEKEKYMDISQKLKKALEEGLC